MLTHRPFPRLLARHLALELDARLCRGEKTQALRVGTQLPPVGVPLRHQPSTKSISNAVYATTCSRFRHVFQLSHHSCTRAYRYITLSRVYVAIRRRTCSFYHGPLSVKLYPTTLRADRAAVLHVLRCSGNHAMWTLLLPPVPAYRGKAVDDFRLFPMSSLQDARLPD